MDLAAPYLNYVLSAYGVSALVLLAVLGSVLLRGARLKRELQSMGLSDPGASKDGA
jgi:heme exporter protein CcmD